MSNAQKCGYWGLYYLVMCGLYEKNRIIIKQPVQWSVRLFFRGSHGTCYDDLWCIFIYIYTWCQVQQTWNLKYCKKHMLWFMQCIIDVFFGINHIIWMYSMLVSMFCSASRGTRTCFRFRFGMHQDEEDLFNFPPHLSLVDVQLLLSILTSFHASFHKYPLNWFNELSTRPAVSNAN